MGTSATRIEEPRALGVRVDEEQLCVELDDGRVLSVPLSWYPRLLHGTTSERRHWRFIGDGEGIHWPDLDEDISVRGLLAGRRSGERTESVLGWLAARKAEK
jgi:hypothetical protein